jgi:hypothetical protein
MSAQPIGIVAEQTAKRAAVIAANPHLSARILGGPRYMPPIKTHRITVNCLTGEREVETTDLDTSIRVVVGKSAPVYVPPKVAQVRQSVKRTVRRPYPLMSKYDRHLVRMTGRHLVKLVSKVSGFSTFALADTSGARTHELTRARWLFFALFQTAHPIITLGELARPLRCDHTIAGRSLPLFILAREEQPIAGWLTHPLLANMLPRLLAMKSAETDRAGAP